MQNDNTELIESIFSFSRLMKEEMSYDSRFLHLSMLQLQALFYINTHEGCQMSEIANNFKIELPSATSLINKLKSLSFVERKTDEKDRRLVRIFLTIKGKSMFEQAMKERSKKLSAILQHLSLQDKTALQEILQKLILKMEQRYEK